jgi:hypothetical protein
VRPYALETKDFLVLKELDHFWQQKFPDIPPLAYDLKRLCADRWVRFHSLPDSKRYAETPEEHKIILERHTTVIEDLNISRSSLFLVTSQWGDSATPDEDRDELSALDPGAVLWRTLPLHELTNNSDVLFLHLFVSSWAWHKSVFDSILALVADDKLRNIMIISSADDWIYHPYDGGADVILKSITDRDTLKQKYFAWLSKHPLGY